MAFSLSLSSNYLHNFGNVSGRPETPQYGAAATMDLFPNVEKPAQYELLDLFPQHTGTVFPSNMEFEGTANATSRFVAPFFPPVYAFLRSTNFIVHS